MCSDLAGIKLSCYEVHKTKQSFDWTESHKVIHTTKGIVSASKCNCNYIKLTLLLYYFIERVYKSNYSSGRTSNR